VLNLLLLSGGLGPFRDLEASCLTNYRSAMPKSMSAIERHGDVAMKYDPPKEDPDAVWDRRSRPSRVALSSIS
jgi:hypothetical protein